MIRLINTRAAHQVVGARASAGDAPGGGDGHPRPMTKVSHTVTVDREQKRRELVRTDNQLVNIRTTGNNLISGSEAPLRGLSHRSM